MTKLTAGEIWQGMIAAVRPQFGVLVAIAAPFTLLVDMVMTLFGPEQPKTTVGFTPQVTLLLVIVPGLIGVIAQLAVAHLIARPEEAPRTALAAALRSLPIYIGTVFALALPMAFVATLLGACSGRHWGVDRARLCCCWRRPFSI